MLVMNTKNESYKIKDVLVEIEISKWPDSSNENIIYRIRKDIVAVNHYECYEQTTRVDYDLMEKYPCEVREFVYKKVLEAISLELDQDMYGEIDDDDDDDDEHLETLNIN